ncbi:hypothetical protein D3C87_1821150 [compost metagenome]
MMKVKMVEVSSSPSVQGMPRITSSMAGVGNAISEAPRSPCSSRVQKLKYWVSIG